MKVDGISWSKCRCGKDARSGFWKCDDCLAQEDLLQGSGKAPYAKAPDKAPVEPRLCQMCCGKISNTEVLLHGLVFCSERCAQMRLDLAHQDDPAELNDAEPLTPAQVTTVVVAELERLDKDAQWRVLRAAEILLGIKGGVAP